MVLAANAPESADSAFTWERFIDGVNKDLADIFGNLVNRCCRSPPALRRRRAGGGPAQVLSSISSPTHSTRTWHACAAIMKAWRCARPPTKSARSGGLPTPISAEAAPWSAIKDDPARAATIVNTGINLVRVSALAAWPFIPSSAEKVLGSLGEAADLVPWPQDGRHALSAIPAGRRVAVPPLLFPKVAVTDLAAAHAS